MANYRIYFKNAAGRIERAEEFVGENDEIAVLYAYTLNDPRGKEVWHEVLCVAAQLPTSQHDGQPSQQSHRAPNLTSAKVGWLEGGRPPIP